MKTSRPFLYPFFEALRREGFSISIEEYEIAVLILRAGYGLESVEDLRQECRLLWLNSIEEYSLFDKLFDEYVKSGFEQSHQDPIHDPPKLPPIIPHKPPPKRPPSFEKYKPLLEKLFPSFQPPASTPSISVQKPYKPAGNYIMQPRWPLNEREMTAPWVHLQRMQREGILAEVDIKATVDKYCQIGSFLGPVMRSQSTNQMSLIILIDVQGSMLPFQPFITQLMAYLKETERYLKALDIYYFHDCPDTYIYRSERLVNAVLWENILIQLDKDTAVLILSDAGAAHRFYDQERIKATKQFLSNLYGQTPLCAWLNPMPKQRWPASTAESISQLIPMYPIDYFGINEAVSVLNGRVA